MPYDYDTMYEFIQRYREVTLWTDSDGNEINVYECRKCFALVNNTDGHTSAVHPELTCSCGTSRVGQEFYPEPRADCPVHAGED